MTTKVSAKTKKINMSALRNSVKDAVASAASDEQAALAKEVAQRARELYEEYTRGWDGGQSFKSAEIETAPGTRLKQRASNRKTYPNLTFEISEPALAGSGYAIRVTTDNDLFRWLDRGTPGMTVKGDRPLMIMTINGHATEVNVPGVKVISPGPWIPVQGNVAGIVARNWSQNIAEALEREFSGTQFNVKVELHG